MKFFVWDYSCKPPENSEYIILWRAFNEDDRSDVISIPKLVEDQADILKSRYLAWIYETGNSLINGKSLLAHLELRPGFSYWWMSLIAYKEPAYISLRITDCLKMLVFEELASKYNPNKIILSSSDRVLAQTFRLWCKKLGWQFDWQKFQSKENSVSWLKKIYQVLPKPVHAGVTLIRSLKKCWSLRKIGKSEVFDSKANITFFSYFDNLDKDACKKNRFYTYYWQSLHDYVETELNGVNWFHKYIKHQMLPSSNHAKTLIKKLNKSADLQSHSTMASTIGFVVIARTLRDYFRIVTVGLRLRKINHLFQIKDSNINLWPLFKQDWEKSLTGANAMMNCLDLNLTEQTLEYLPFQKSGFYLQENQPWEMALIHAWKKFGHGKLVGVQHTTVRYWDLRYFYDQRTYHDRTGTVNTLPRPDKVAVNGPAASKLYLDGGYPEDEIVEVEALRYYYLTDFLSAQKNKKFASTSKALHVLVLTDFSPRVTTQQMQLLSEAASLMPANTKYTIKSHPNCQVRAEDYAGMNFEVKNYVLSELLQNHFDVVFSSNITSAAVDAFCVGLPVVSVLDGQTLNLSPLRGLNGAAEYVTGPKELADALQKTGNRQTGRDESFFFLDKKLEKWKKLL
jgi:surface carbohydrate biosynthesis protein (TIGR04326 family)